MHETDGCMLCLFALCQQQLTRSHQRHTANNLSRNSCAVARAQPSVIQSSAGNGGTEACVHTEQANVEMMPETASAVKERMPEERLPVQL